MKGLVQAAVAQQETNHLLRQEIKILAEKMDKSANPGPVFPGRIRASDHLQKMTPTDDVEAYLLTFERTAEREEWPKEKWAGLLAPFLTGDAQKAYFDLELEDAKDYTKLKAEILARLGVTQSVRAQRFHQWMYSAEKAPRSQMFDLVHLARKWLQPETSTPAQIVECVVMDRFLRGLPPGLRRWIGQEDPVNANALVTLVERHIAATELVRNTAPDPSQKEDRLRRSPIPETRFSIRTGKTVPGERGVEERQVAAKGLGKTLSKGEWSPLKTVRERVSTKGTPPSMYRC